MTYDHRQNWLRLTIDYVTCNGEIRHVSSTRIPICVCYCWPLQSLGFNFINGRLHKHFQLAFGDEHAVLPTSIPCVSDRYPADTGVCQRRLVGAGVVAIKWVSTGAVLRGAWASMLFWDLEMDADPEMLPTGMSASIRRS